MSHILILEKKLKTGCICPVALCAHLGSKGNAWVINYNSLRGTVTSWAEAELPSLICFQVFHGATALLV